jgi:hypothetical protein
MFVGHYAVGLVLKRVEPEISLGTFVLAAMFADFLWAPLLLLGIEHVQLKPGIGAENYFDPSNINIVWSHSLLMDAVWAALFAAIYWLWRRNRVGAWQHRRTATAEPSRGAIAQPDSLHVDGGMGLLDEPAQACPRLGHLAHVG